MKMTNTAMNYHSNILRIAKRGMLMMENLTHSETRIGHNRLKLVGIKDFMDG